MKAKEILFGCALLAGAACAYQVGDRLGGFEVTAVTPVPEVKGTLVRMTYPKNGAELAWLDRADDNMTFSIAFRTIPQDDTGVAHILEHSVLCGSEKYPVKEPFVELLKSSFATFINAWTSSDYTAYPACSRNRKDFLNLVDVYMDAVLHPLSVKSPLPFHQEGWHWDLEGPDAELGRNGVVYSEMKGGFANPERLLYHELRRMLFPDNTYRFVSGGDPARIPDLTFEKYKEFYFRHYHPSNARIFLDGRVDLPAVLAKLDAYLAPYDRQAVDASVPFQKPVSAAKTIPYEIAPGENPANKTLVADAWVFAPWKDRERGLAFDVLSDALADSNEAPLTKALLSRGLCEDVGLWCGGDEQRAATFYAKNVKDGKAGEVRRVMRETLEGLAAKGLDHARIAAVLDRHEFREREKDTGGFPRGLAYFSDANEAWMYGGDPTEAFRHAHLYASLRAKLKTGWFEKFLREALLDNPHHVQLTMTPSATLAAERAAAEKKALAAVKAGWSKKQLDEVLALTRELAEHQKRPDAPADLAKLPRLAVADVPVRGPERVQALTWIPCGGSVPVLSPRTGANGITYVKLYFQLHGLSREELADVYLLTKLFGELATEKRSALALRSEIDSRLGSFGVSVDVEGQSSGEATAYVVVTVSALEEKKNEIIRLVPEILLKTKFDDVKAIGDILRQQRRSKERGTMGIGARNYADRRAKAALSERGLREEIVAGLTQIRHLQKLDDAYAKDGAAICTRLDALRRRIFDTSRIALCCVADNTPADWAKGLLTAFPQSAAWWRFAPYGLPPKVAEGFRTPGKVAFAAKASRPGPYVGSSVVAARVLSLDYLWDEIRVRGGAYGGSFRVHQDGDGGYLSWNDPKPGRSLGCYDKSGDALRAFAKGDAALDRYVVSAVASTEPYETPSAEVANAAARYLQGRTPEDVQRLRAEMLRTTKGDLLKFADVLDGLVRDGSICVVGGGAAFDSATNQLQRVESVQRAACVAGAGKVEWNTPESLATWTKRGHQVTSATVTDGALHVVCGGADTHVYSGKFDLASSAAQEVVFRAKGNVSGTGELFWMEPGKAPTQAQSVRFDWIGDGEWHDYRVRPFWQCRPRIGQLRLDFPIGAAQVGVFDVSSVAIVSAAEMTAFSAADWGGLVFDVKADAPGTGQFCWASSVRSGLRKTGFRYPGDGRVHRIYLDLSSHSDWRGVVSWTNLVTDAAQVSSMAFVKDEPELPADLVVKGARAEDAFNRVGEQVPVRVSIENIGTRTAGHVSLTAGPLPAGVRLANAAALADLGDLCGLETKSFIAAFEVAAPCAFTAQFFLRADGVAPIPFSVPVKVLPSLGLAKASYVPEPKPVETDYDIAALYFPGWARAEAWQRIWNVCPERKPVLGWYDEANPEVVDWQIKWLVENGIRTLYVDWYWNRGNQHLDHWVKAFYKARYRRHLKWAMMWANHNAAGSHSEEDQRAVTKFWIENYFNTPEYLRIDDMPVVWIWAAGNMDRDVGPGGCKKLLEISRQMAREAGYKGIYFIAMKFPETDWGAGIVQMYKNRGFDMTGIYHFMDHGGKAKSNRRYSYDLCVETSLPAWRKRQASGILPFMPNLSTGWDDRPWKDHCEIYGKSVEGFRRICADAKRFADETGVKRLCVAPLNEWGEGSYAEPNAEYGFGFYEAVRDTFCKRPAEGWPLNYGPKDVGLGPYDLPPPAPMPRVSAWDFTGGDAQGWRSLMGLSDFAPSPRGITFRTATRDPAVCVSFAPIEARSYGEVVVRMKVEGTVAAGRCQLFWAGSGRKVAEVSSVTLPVKLDGAFHDYRLPVGTNRNWRGRINHFRFDPVQAAGLRVTIESVRLAPRAQ